MIHLHPRHLIRCLPLWLACCLMFGSCSTTETSAIFWLMWPFKISLPALNPKLEAELTAYLDQHALPPEDYVISKFKDHDIVFLGEYHRIKHDPLLVQNLIPNLYQAGVRHLGIEFARAAEQADIDRLLSAPAYDEALANRIFWKPWPGWGFQEYVDILRVAWQLNRELPAGAPLFRVLGLNARADWSFIWTPEDRENKELMKKVLPDGAFDEVMAATIVREILDKKEKALIYSGSHHAFTRFHQPIVDEKTGALKGSWTTRMGNRIYDLIGDRCCMIFLHSPWWPAKGAAYLTIYPAEGVIDALMAKLPPENRRVGFDVKGSPFGRLPDKSSLYGRSADDFRLDMFCDGWIYQKPLSQCEGCTVIEGWINEENRLEAIAQQPNPDAKSKDRTAESMMQEMRKDTNFKRRFKRLH